MRSFKMLFCYLERFLISDSALTTGILLLTSGSELSDVAVVVTLHLLVEDLGFSSRGVPDEMAVTQIEDVSAHS